MSAAPPNQPTDHPADQPTDTPPREGLGPWMSMAMVVGTLIGSAIFLLPAVLAPYGPNIAFAWLISIGGTMCIAYAMARLAARVAGGPTAYITRAFGDVPAFLTLWSYVVSVWAGLAAVALAIAGALSYIFPATATTGGIFIVASGSILLLLLINLTGIRAAGRLQVAATLIKLLPLLAVLLFVAGRAGSGRPLEPLAAVPLSGMGILAAASLTLFSLSGFEVGVITAPVTENAARNVPRAQILGVGFTGLIYLTTTLAALLLLPSAIAAHSKAPFADAISPVLGSAAGLVVALIAAISAFGANNALLLGCGQILHSLARQGDLPPLFARLRSNGVPAAGLALSAIVPIVLLVFASAPSFVEIYAFVALISAIASLILYAMCSAAVLKLKLAGGALGMFVAAVAIIYAIAMFFGAGWEATKWGLVLAISGIPIRWISRRLWPSPAPAAAPAAPPGSSA